MTKKDYTLRVRMDDKLGEKLKDYVEKSEDYDNVSELMRDLVRDFLSGKLVYSASSVSKNIQTNKTEILGTVKEIFDAGINKIMKSNEDTKERMGLFIQFVENGFQTFPPETMESKRRWNIEEAIIRLIEIKPMTSEELGKAFKMTESRILRFLNPMLKEKTIGLNNQMEYVLVQTKKQVNELSFGDD